MAKQRPRLEPDSPTDEEPLSPDVLEEGGAGVPPLDEEVVDPTAAVAYHQRARLAEDRLAEVLTAYRQLKTENEEHRERVSRNLERRFRERHDRLLLRFMDILDNLDRALEAVQTSYADNSLVEGLILVRSQLLQTLQEQGLERIPVLGLPYDPHVSEAMGTEPVEDEEQHHVVVRELLRGYRLNGRVARASQVVLGVHAEPRAEEREAPVTQPRAPGRKTEGGDDTLEAIIARVEALEAHVPEGALPEDTAEDGAPALLPEEDEHPGSWSEDDPAGDDEAEPEPPADPDDDR